MQSLKLQVLCLQEGNNTVTSSLQLRVAYLPYLHVQIALDFDAIL